MAFGETTVGGAALVKADGRIDMSNADAFKDSLISAVSTAKSAVIVDMAGVDYISSAGLRSLMIAFRSAKAAGKAFGVAALTPLVLEIFTISRFNLVFPLYGGVREALYAVGAPSSPNTGGGGLA
jgi:anti-sigma B factor antagonist